MQICCFILLLIKFTLLYRKHGIEADSSPPSVSDFELAESVKETPVPKVKEEKTKTKVEEEEHIPAYLGNYFNNF